MRSLRYVLLVFGLVCVFSCSGMADQVIGVGSDASAAASDAASKIVDQIDGDDEVTIDDVLTLQVGSLTIASTDYTVVDTNPGADPPLGDEASEHAALYAAITFLMF